MRIALLILGVVVLAPNAASASAWGWLEQFSGPGPYQGDTILYTECGKAPSYTSTTDTTAPGGAFPAGTLFSRAAPLAVVLNEARPSTRVSDYQQVYSEIKPELFGAVRTVTNGSSVTVERYRSVGRRPCFFADFGRFKADANPTRGFPRIDVTTVDLGGAFRFWDSIDIGSGIGFLNISPDGHESNTHFTVTPFRLTARPLLMIFDNRASRGGVREALSLLSVYWKGVYVMGPLDGKDFGGDEKSFQATGDFVQSAGAIIDLSAAGHLIARAIQ
jgi:hypothetical protein